MDSLLSEPPGKPIDKPNCTVNLSGEDRCPTFSQAGELQRLLHVLFKEPSKGIDFFFFFGNLGNFAE